MFIDVFLEAFNRQKNNEAIIWKENIFSYSDLINKINYFKKQIEKNNITPGTIISIDGNFSTSVISLFFALIEKQCIILPVYNTSTSLKNQYYEIAQVELECNFKNDEPVFTSTKKTATHQFFEILKKRKHPGLILFSSGSSGEPKAAVHDFSLLLEKFKLKRKAYRTLNFLLFDHWGGLNTMFHVLANEGTLVLTDDRSSENICKLIEKYNIELFPTSPTFLNLMLVSEFYKMYDLTSLKIISYGTEPMPQSVLDKLNKIFPNVKIQQTYGLIEIGVLRTISENNNSLWLKLGGEGIETRIVDDVLQIKTKSAMLGYLNAPSPFTKDGWFNTQDKVQVKDGFFKILGRESDIINVGGEKVYPTEVETIIQQLDEVSEVTVFGKTNPILGNIVCATIRLIKNQDPDIFKIKLKKHCKEKLKKFMIPVKITFDEKKQYNYRFKKIKKRN